MKKYHYFLSYKYELGQGMCEITRSDPITQYSELKAIVELLEREFNKKGVIIISYQLLRIEEQPENKEKIEVDLSFLGKNTGFED